MGAERLLFGWLCPEPRLLLPYSLEVAPLLPLRVDAPPNLSGDVVLSYGAFSAFVLIVFLLDLEPVPCTDVLSAFVEVHQRVAEAD